MMNVIDNNIHINGSIINIQYVYNIGEVLCVIPFTDFILIKCFGSTARWFQLHSAINFFITYLIRNDIYSFIFYPLYAIRVNTDYKVVYYIIYLHTYHFFIKKLHLIELIHHILFVFMGVLPCIFFWKYNIINLWILSGCGLPGAIEYFLLSLVKNDMLSSKKQKYISANINNYMRLPITMYGLSLTYIAYIERLIYCNSIFFIYVCILIYTNGTFFNKLAIENYTKYKYTNKIDYNI